MNLPAQLFNPDLLWLANFVFGGFCLHALRTMRWRELLTNPARINALVGLTLGAFLFWQMNAGIKPGFNHHILGATLFMLMFGWHMALVTLLLVMVASWLRADIALVTLGLNGLLMLVIPLLFSHAVLIYSQHHLPKNVFLFVLLNGFLCSALAILLTVLSASLVMSALSEYSWNKVLHNYLAYSPIIALTEAFTTGMLITAFTVFKPEAVFNYDEDAYTLGK
ncbi:MAG: energy-coupling factor ABC transporter permease [Gallionella sp.]|nr:energy-coupling factor ABC transporter permease [Gallionella sp.]